MILNPFLPVVYVSFFPVLKLGLHKHGCSWLNKMYSSVPVYKHTGQNINITTAEALKDMLFYDFSSAREANQGVISCDRSSEINLVRSGRK